MKYLIPFQIFFLLSSFSNAQSNAAFSMNFDHVALSVIDVDQSAVFYKNALNLKEIVNRGKVEGIRWFALGEGKELHLISTISGDIKINKAVHFAVTASNFDAFIERLQSMNITYSDWPGILNRISLRADGIRQVYIQDPDGYWIEVNSTTEQD